MYYNKYIFLTCANAVARTFEAAHDLVYDDNRCQGELFSRCLVVANFLTESTF